MKPILIVQHEEDAGPGHFERYLSKNNLPQETVRVFAGDAMPVSAATYAGICSLGGSMSVNDDLPWISKEVALMRNADQLGVPIIGHCLGGQLLASAFDAPVARNAMKEIGWSTVEVDDADLAREWAGAESAFELFQWHGDTFTVPSDGRRFLTSRLCSNQAFVIERGKCAHLGMQFHIEMTPELVQAWVTDAQGANEIDEAIKRQAGIGVQRPEEMLRDIDERTQRMSLIADRLYERWVRGLFS